MSDLSEWFGGSCNYSKRRLDAIKSHIRFMSNIEKMTVGKELVKMYKAEVKKDRREQFPMEDWIKVSYNKYS